MTLHKCPTCQKLKSSVAMDERDRRDAARKRARHPYDPRYVTGLEQAEAHLADTRRFLEEHEAECTFVPEAPAPIRGTMAQRRKPKPPGARELARAERIAAVPSRAELAAILDDYLPVRVAMAAPPAAGDGNVLPATGFCHDCDKPVGPDRRFCGSCTVKRGHVL